MSQPTNPPPAAAAPPTRTREPVWPIVLGVIATIFGVMGILGGCWSGLSPVFLEWMQKLFAEAGIPGMEVQSAQFQAMGAYGWALAGLGIVSALVAGLLLAAGIGLTRRRRWALRASVTWAVAKMVVSVPAAWIGYEMNIAMFEAMSEEAAQQSSSPATAPAGLYDMLEVLVPVFVVFGLLWAWALPVFFLIWFRRSAIKAQVKAWS